MARPIFSLALPANSRIFPFAWSSVLCFIFCLHGERLFAYKLEQRTSLHVTYAAGVESPQMKVLLIAVAVGVCLWAVSRPADIPFEKHTLDLGANETCAIADISGDGRPDIVSGENWYEAPTWTRHKFRELNFSNNYVDNFSDLALDVNGDGRIDIISASWFSRRLAWFENPGKSGGSWKEHPIDSGAPNEFAFLVDLDNDGKAREVLPQFGDEKTPLAWYEPQGRRHV